MASFPKPPTLNDDERATEIYRAAAKIIRNKGFDATSMGDIAEAVDLTKGGLYYYIKGKEALLYAIMCFALDQLEKRVLDPARAIEEPERRLSRMLGGHLELMIDEVNAMVVLADEREGLKADHAAKIGERFGRYSSLLQETVSQVLAARGEVDLSVELVAGVLTSQIEGVVRWFDDSIQLTREQVVRQCTRLMLESLRLRD